MASFQKARRAAAEGRQKIMDMATELRGTSRGISWSEGLPDKIMVEWAPKPL